MKKIHQLAAILLSGILLLTAGCSKPIDLPEKPTVPPEATEAISEDTSLFSLRQAMVETPQVFAVAYFGYQNNWDSDLPVDPI